MELSSGTVDGAGSPTRADFDQARRGLRERLADPSLPQSDEDTTTSSCRLSPEQRQESSDKVPPLPVPVEPLVFDASSPSPGSVNTQASSFSMDGAMGLGGTAARVRADGQRQNRSPPSVQSSGSQRRRRGLLAACSTPRSSTPRVATDDLSAHHSIWVKTHTASGCAASSLLDGLSSPAIDNLSGGVDGLYRWPVTHQHRPDPVRLCQLHVVSAPSRAPVTL